MARGSGSGTERKRAPRDFGRRGGKKKVCVFCKEHLWVDYKDVNLLRRFQSDRGKIRARRVTGNCTQHHREVAIAIKTARELALLPYTQRTVVERAGGRSLRVTSPPGPPPVPPAEGAPGVEGDEGELALVPDEVTGGSEQPEAEAEEEEEEEAS